MGSSRRSLVGVAALSLIAGTASAQGGGPLVLAGRVVRVSGGDSVPLAGVFAVGHHVGTQRQGPVDSVRTDAAGRFRIVVPRPDTAGLYVVSVRHHGIGYFGTPLGPDDRTGAGMIVLAVFDTGTAGPPLSLAMRHIVVTAPETDGSRRVLDILQVRNPGPTTRVSGDSTAPTWQIRLPSGVVDLQPGEGEVSPEAMSLDGNVLRVAAPFPPGEKQVIVGYVLPAGARDLRMPVDQITARFDVLVEDAEAEASGGGIRPVEPLVLEGRRFRRFGADGLESGAEVRLRFGAVRGSGSGRRFTWVVVVAAGAALSAGLVLALRRRDSVPAVEAEVPDDPDAIAGAIAALDERYEGREGETPPGEWRGYRTRRALLAERLRAALARRGAS